MDHQTAIAQIVAAGLCVHEPVPGQLHLDVCRGAGLPHHSIMLPSAISEDPEKELAAAIVEADKHLPPLV